MKSSNHRFTEQRIPPPVELPHFLADMAERDARNAAVRARVLWCARNLEGE